MASRAIATSRLDRLAMGLSGLCAAHCVATAVLLGLLASAGGLLGRPIIHEVGLSVAMVIGAIAFVRGLREHGFLLPCMVGFVGLGVMGFALTLHETGYEPVVTVAGVSLLALGHRLNMMAKQPSF
ncbi:MAG TPA: MerC domain-containing protein [Sphingomicrobium sp.]